MENVMRKKEMDKETAQKYIIETDLKREELIRTFLNKKQRNIDNLFDVTINRKSFPVDEISGFVASMYERKMAVQKAERDKIKSVL